MAMSSGRLARHLVTEMRKKQRLIGIHHALKQLREAGLIEDNAKFPYQAVRNLRDLIMSAYQRGYEAGARRGALQVLEAISDGDLEVGKDKHGGLKARANVEAIEWKRSLRVSCGTEERVIPSRTYKLSRKRLGLERTIKARSRSGSP